MDAESVVRAELDAWHTLAVDKIMAPFAHDAVWEAGPRDVFSGSEAIRQAVGGYVGLTTSGNIEIRHLAVIGDVVLTERIDHFVYDGRQIDVRVMGTFEVAEGKITAWRDYFDASRLLSLGLAAVPLAACGQSGLAIERSSTTSRTSVTVTSTTTSVGVPAPPVTRTVKWVDLQIGDCVAEVPAVELGAVTATIVDCATTHQAEVYLLAPIAVNAAITDVASRECAAGLTPYTGQAAGDAFTVTYLIDSRQDRTSNNPLPSTVICLLQPANGQALTESARR